MRIPIRLVLLAQGVYYLATGLWPIVDMEAFEAVTGPKTDDWLVEMVGLLAASIGLSLVMLSGKPGAAGVTLAASTAASFAAIDVIHSLLGTISLVYLADAVIQFGALGLLAAAWRNREEPASPGLGA